jgi:hypothetical protein
MRIHTVTALLSLSLVFAECEDWGGPPPEIILGVSISGIHLGDTPEQVQRLLGPPERVGWGSGEDRSWRVYGYGYDAAAHVVDLHIYFISSAQSEWGPVDMISVGHAYRGTTKEGLGIGATRDRVRALIGLPFSTNEPDSLGRSNEYYCFLGRRVELNFERDTVHLLSLGPLAPPPNTPICR